MWDARMFVEIRDLTWRYPDESTNVFEGFGLQLGSPGVGLVHGANMSGKSTLLKIIAGDLRTARGVVVRARPCEYLPQAYDDSLFWWQTVRWNLFASWLVQGVPIPDEQAHAALEGLGLQVMIPHLDSLPGTGSGGFRHLIALTRALLSPAPLILLDEPFTGLDAARQQLVLGALRTVTSRSPEKQFLVVTHESDLAAQLNPTFVLRFPGVVPVRTLTLQGGSEAVA